MVPSPELTGGAGFTFEDAAVAIYLAALLGEENAPGLLGRVVVRVALQQAAFGEALDDLIVDARAPDGGLARLSLQVKRHLTISAAPTNSDFREIVLRAWETINMEGFRDGVDRVGAVAGTISDASKRALETICEWARDSATAETFMARFAVGGSSGQRHRAVLNSFREALAGSPAGDLGDEEIHRLLRHFVLLRFNLLHEGSVLEANTVARLRHHLSSGDTDRATDLWHHLRVIAREAAGRAAEFARPTLLSRLGGSFRLAGAHSLRPDLDRLAEEAKLSLATISTEIGGYRVSRPNLISGAEDRVQERLFLQITGLPGTGKSAVLRELAESRLDLSPTLVIKSDRIEGRNWLTYARGLGLASTCLEALLLEITAVGCPILFIDGLDRIEVQHRGIVIDLVNTILNSQILRAEWRVVATVRDNGIEPLRTWLPAGLAQESGISTVTVEPFDDTEAARLAKAKPALRPLLFGEERVREIARRPFFAAVLVGPAFELQGGPLTPRSETELMDAWWARGGCLTTPSMVAHRQHALLRLARAGAAKLGRRIGLDDFDIDVIEELKRDGVLRDASPGHSVQFVHDIFFEWSFAQLLLSREDSWLEEVHSVGEPPVLGRAVELLSQRKFSTDDNWAQHLARVEESSMRSQWTRAWLLGPMGAADFADRAASFGAAVFWDKAQRLIKLLIWFQAEKTRPNPLILGQRGAIEGLSSREIEQAADAYGVPSDYLTWNRCCNWILDNIDRCPVKAIPDVVSVFEVWQNAVADIPNETSDRIIDQTRAWLEDIEDRLHAEDSSYDRGPWQALGRGALEELEDRLRALLLRAARLKREIARAYLTRLRTRPQLRDHAFKQTLPFAPFLSETLASELVDLTLATLKEDLPADVAARPIPHGVLLGSFTHFEWDRLAVDRGTQSFYPPSPLREPFSSLFHNDPGEARRLVRELANHAITAWRQLFELDWERRATPIPLILDFPWGQQAFWGDERVYTWFRGHRAPNAVAAGLMALEHWAFGQVEQGRGVDEVIQEVVSGHESVAVLGIAVALALSARRVSATTLPLATTQRLWHWDLSRALQDSTSPANLIGFSFTELADLRHSEAVRDGNDREVRRLEIRFLAQLFVLWSDDELRTAAQAAIQAFPEDLPFDFEEERNEGRIAWLKRTAEIWADLGREEYYTSVRAEDGKGVLIQFNNPRATDPDMIAAAEQHKTMTERLRVLNWVHDCFKHERLSNELPMSEALEYAQRLDAPDLFTTPYRDLGSIDQPQNVISGVAAVMLSFSQELDESDLAWATDVILRAATTPEDRQEPWFPGTILLHHPSLSAVRGVSALLRRKIVVPDAKRALVRLAGHPLEQISQTAIGAAMALWDQDPAFAWSALDLGLKLSIGTAEGRGIPPHGLDHTRDHVGQAVEEAIRGLDAPVSQPLAALHSIPVAWVYAPPLPRDYPFGGSRQSSDPVWRDPDVFLRWDFLTKVLRLVPTEQVMSDPSRRPAFLNLCDQLVVWTIERLNPPWQSDRKDRRDRRASELIEWRASLFQFLALVALHTDQNEARRRFLEPIFALDDDLAASFIRPFAEMLVCSIMDAPVIRPHTITLIAACLERVLRHKDWAGARKYDGKLHGFDLPALVRTFLFVQVEHAGGAARFANGDWREVESILPIVDPFVRAVGDLPSVTSAFLTLCERATDHYPPDQFVEEISAVLAKQPGTPVGWRGSTIQGRTAALIQVFAQQTQPLPPSLAEGMLRMLDRLIDMGDRRSAALQTSEIFKNVAMSRAAAPPQ